MKTRRLTFILVVFFVIMLYLASVCLKICVVNGREYTESAVMQRKGSYVIKKGRGIFADRNLIPLVETELKSYTVNPDGHLCADGGKSIPPVTVRYGANSIAKHLIGYVDTDGRGVCGLEKAMEEYLLSDGESTLTAMRGADGRIIDGAGVRVEEAEGGKNTVVLTIDSHIQKIAENALSDHGVTGAVVILDTESFDVLAMASSPDYDQNNIADFVGASNGELVNRCLMPYNAGSIFKIVTLLSGLENYKIQPSYFCGGSVKIADRDFACHDYNGHGITNYITAFGSSCNCAFYKMGMDIGQVAMTDTASRLGLGGCVLDGLELYENGGNLPEGTAFSPLDCVNLAIGQGSVLVTPLQVANMVCIIANGGIRKDVNVVNHVTDENGRLSKVLRKDGEGRVVNGYIASLVGEAMRQAVTDGTAKALSNLSTAVAGKTGTAETGWIKDGRNLVHGWFCGFFPYNNPRYAMAVLCEDGGSGAQSAVPVFGRIAEEIAKIYPEG